MRERLSLLAAALWFGSLTTIGFLVVPLLFKHMPSAPMAGAIAAKLFAAQTWVSLGLGLLLLTISQPKEPDAGMNRSSTAIGFIAAGMLTALLVEFAVAPRIVSARATGGDLRLWHGVGAALFVAQLGCTLALLWHYSSRRNPR